MTVAQSDDVRQLVLTLFMALLVYISHRSAKKQRADPVETIVLRFFEVLCACGVVVCAAPLVVSLLNINVLNAAVLVAGALFAIFIVPSSIRWLMRRLRLPRDHGTG